jgi:hypothetical protein
MARPQENTLSTIWKFPLEITDEQEINVPVGAKILCLQMQEGLPCLWVQVNPQASTYPMRIVMYGTGHEITDTPNLRYLGSFQCYGGTFVSHVFEQVP